MILSSFFFSKLHFQQERSQSDYRNRLRQQAGLSTRPPLHRLMLILSIGDYDSNDANTDVVGQVHRNYLSWTLIYGTLTSIVRDGSLT